MRASIRRSASTSASAQSHSACGSCGRATCSWSGSSTASAAIWLIWSNTVQDLSACGVGLRVLAGQGAQIDTTTATGPARVRHLRGAGEFERELIRERTVAGLKAARARGRKGGRKFALSKAQVWLAQAAMAHPRHVGVRTCAANSASRRPAGPAAREQGQEGPRLLNRRTVTRVGLSVGSRPLPQTTRVPAFGSFPSGQRQGPGGAPVDQSCSTSNREQPRAAQLFSCSPATADDFLGTDRTARIALIEGKFTALRILG